MIRSKNQKEFQSQNTKIRFRVNVFKLVFESVNM